MTKTDWNQYPPIPGFDSVKWKEERQAKIYEETRHMTPEEQRERTRKNAEEFDKKLEWLRKKLAKRKAADKQT
jgi:hypothetical protein